MASRPNARWTSTLQFVYAPLVCKATLWLLVLRPGVVVTMNVPQIKFVTLLLAVASHARNAKPFVIQAIVPEELIALPKITEKPASADTP